MGETTSALREIDAAPDPADGVRDCLLWAARRLQPGGGVYPGRVRVRIEFPAERSSVVIRPTRRVGGREHPDLLRLAGPAALEVAALLKHMLSDKERFMLRSLLARQPARATDVLEGARVTRADFWPLWGGLQVRGLVAERDDGRFEVAVPWVAALVGEGLRPCDGDG